MTKEKTFRYLLPVDIERVKGISDEIFAFSMTLLIINVTVPHLLPGQTVDVLPSLLKAQWRDYLIYMTSFLHISNYWMMHFVVFANITHSDRILVRLNLCLLLAVTFTPYPTALLSEYGQQPVTILIYGITIIVVYLLLGFMAWYAYQDNRLTNEELYLPVKKVLLLRMGIPLVIALLGTVLSINFPYLGVFFFLIIAVFNLIPASLYIKDINILDYNNTPSDSEKQ